MSNYIKTFLKGFAMGTSDIIPGVSGGTIAFITGIYEKFIHSIKNLTTKEFFQMKIKFLKGDFNGFKKDFLKLDFDFLIILLLGIFSAIFIVSKLMLFLLENYLNFTLAFFVGLILASTIFIKREIKKHNNLNYLIGNLGFIVGLSLILFNTYNLASAPLYYISFGGFLAISAMFLPGISGSFILYILGLYNIVLSALHNLKEEWKVIVSFAGGAILGAVCISRFIDFLFRKDKSKTLYFLLGLIIGALAVPLKTIYIETSFNLMNLILLCLMCLIGFSIVFIIQRIALKLENRN